VNSADIKVQVKNSKAILKGSVSDYTTLNVAERDAWIVEGVKKVKNNLKVKIPSELTIPTDSKIESNIEDLLRLDFDINPDNIDISVKNGVVRLEGTVNSLWKKYRAEEIASDVLGVLDLINKIKIVPTEKQIDENIADDIIRALDRSYRIDVDDVNIKVRNGKVTVSGTIPNWIVYTNIIDIIRFTPGTREIEDKLVIE